MSIIHSLPKYDIKPMQLAKTSFQRPPDLNPREQEAIKWYREHGYSVINSELGGFKPEFKMPSKKAMKKDYGFHMTPHEAITHLDDVIAKAPVRKKTLYVYRGERNAKRTKELANMEIGSSYFNPTFQSNSLGPSYAFYAFSRHQETPLLSMTIVTPSVPGVYIDDENHTEMEFLIGRNITYTLIDKRMIPNKNRGHHIKELLLLIWNAGEKLKHNPPSERLLASNF